MQSSIPKFSSFRTKTPAPEKPRDDLRRSKKTGRHKRKLSTSSIRSSDKLGRQNTHAKEAHALLTTSPDTRLSEDNNLDALFVVDCKGDRDNLIYGENSRHRVPVYYSSSGISALGERRKQWGFRPTSRPLTSLGHSEVVKLRAEGKQIHLRSEKIEPAHPEDYISLKLARGFSDSYQAKHHVLGIKAWEDTHNDLEAAKMSSSDESDVEDQKDDEIERGRIYRGAQARLSSIVEQEPENVQAWLQYIDHGELWPDENELPIASSSRDLRASVAEVKLAMFTKALKAVPRSNSEWPLLVSRMMEEAEKSLEPAKVAAKWKEWLLLSGESPRLCVEYLNFVQRFASEFRYEHALEIFHRCLRALRQVRQKHLEHNVDELEVYVLLRLTVFMQQAGMHELAIALWQSVLEIKFFSPVKVDLDTQGTSEFGVLKAFEEFFNNEQPRIGEAEAAGWRNAQHTQFSKSEFDYTESQYNPSSIYSSFESWGRKELSCARQNQLPGRTSDATDEEDPYHVVLFSDIKMYLEALRLRAPGEFLVDALLCFLRMPPLPQSRLPQEWRTDPFLTRHTASLDLSNLVLESSAPIYNLTGRNQEGYEHSLASAIPQVCQTTTEILLASSTSFNSFGNVDQGNSGFVKNILKLLVQAMPHHDELAEYYLTFIAAVFPEEAVKSAKLLLKQRSSNLRLYNAYALIEARQKGGANSDRIFSTAISMSTTLDSSSTRAAGLMRRTWAWEALRKGDYHSALQRLCKSLRGVIDTRQTEMHRNAALQLGDYNDAAIHSECLALICYLANGTDLTAGLDVFDTELNLLEARAGSLSSAVECLHQYRAQLLAHHIALKHVCKPALIRAALQESIHAFPNNTMFLQLYVETEARFRIDDRVRQVLHDSMPSDKNVLHWAYVIQNETRRADYQGSTSQSIRSTFEAALASRDCGSSVMLWTFYFHFTLRSGDYQHAKAILYRGLREIPWVKEFAMLAFIHLRDVLSFDELFDIHSTMVDRGLRLHVDLEEFIS